MTKNWMTWLALTPWPLSAWAVDAQKMELGPVDFTPTLEVGERYDDNFRALDRDKDSAWITSIKPTFLFTRESRNSAYQLEYSADSQTYLGASNANHIDHDAVGRAAWAFDSRNRLDASLNYRRAEETADTASPDENDKYTQRGGRLKYAFGALSAANQLELATSYQQTRYRNGGGLNDDKDRNTSVVTGTWFHRIGGSTRGLVEASYGDYDYLDDNLRNSKSQRLLVGIDRDVSAKLSGTARVGYERKDFDSSASNDYGSGTWEVGMDYKPRTYSVFSVNLRRSFDEGDDGASTVHVTSSRLGWRHTWSAFFATDVSYRHASRDYLGTGGREDRLNVAGAELIYTATRWADVTLGYQRWDNDSNVNTEDYTRNIYLLSLKLSL
ncbi:outer membrane beta-barrel protein [Pseudomonas sp. NPDC007930]|uniref:outer membrane beta-barrel protein n=1 Tax=Pseudomonas sp. NPDC007930 TaxID=3364417 RepID=UPI0036E4226A